jgi:hypothetical protein
MTEQDRKDVEQVLYAVKRVEWAGPNATCLVCHRLKAYGQHPCSCPMRLAQKAADRLLVQRVDAVA